ncbi:CIC11C00000003571 [Sungouiella intermedia]|uniref:CIC11C00000003571 n=1 Tax=Sungouiella intermedia TaxID=45354 RepID=A0A1L0D123_9ASCO|nr:CIC11C00000003571 [[Candida] intermedia]
MLSGRNIFITGASRGIGLALSNKLALLGSTITMVARNEDLLVDNIRKLPTSKDQQHKYVSYDLMSLARGVKPNNHGFLVENLEKANILINCAGLATYKLMPKLTDDGILDVVDLNLVAPILLSKMAIPSMLKQGRRTPVPSILNISSLLSATGTAVSGTSAYAALKAGLLGLTEALAKELNGKIRVNAVLPALVPETDMGKNASANLPTVSLLDVVDTCVKVLEDESVNGKFVPADGGKFRTLN